MTVVAFSLTGEPRGKGRPRTRIRGSFAQVYTDPVTRAYEQSIRSHAERVMCGKPPLEGPLSVSLRLRLSVPISYSKKARARILAGEEAYLGRVDADNAFKALADALNGILWRDDVQITRLFVTKEAATEPGIDVRVEALAPQ
jgi:Holliday junction resolvase RusA-like endonuclease